MEIVLKRKWFGRKKGTTLNLVEIVAQKLIRRGVAESLAVHEARKKKQMSRPQKNKMVTAAANKAI